MIYKYEVKRTLIKERPTENPMSSPNAIYDLFKDYFSGLTREHFEVLHLDTKNKVIGKEVISIGTLDATVVHARDIFKSAIIQNSASIILMHNHPSGDPNPSRDDLKTSEKIKSVGEIVGIKVLDHIIFGDYFYSMKQNCEIF